MLYFIDKNNTTTKFTIKLLFYDIWKLYNFLLLFILDKDI